MSRLTKSTPHFTKSSIKRFPDLKPPLVEKKNGTKRSSFFITPTTTVLFGGKGSGKSSVIYAIVRDHLKYFPLVELEREEEVETPILSRLMFETPQEVAEKEPEYIRKIVVTYISPNVNADPVTQKTIRMIEDAGGFVKTLDGLYRLNEETGKEENVMAGVIDYIKESEDDNDDIVIIDDSAVDLKRNRYVGSLLKNSRHTGRGIVNVIISTQSRTDVQPEIFTSVDYYFLFRSISVKHLLGLYTHLGIEIPQETFLEMWRDATKDKHGFLLLDRRQLRYYNRHWQEYYPNND